MALLRDLRRAALVRLFVCAGQVAVATTGLAAPSALGLQRRRTGAVGCVRTLPYARLRLRLQRIGRALVARCLARPQR